MKDERLSACPSYRRAEQTGKTKEQLIKELVELRKRITELEASETERRRAEEQAFRESTLLETINKVLRETLTCKTDEEVARTCLAVAEELTGSKFCFIGEVNHEGRFGTIALSNPRWDTSKMPQLEATKLIKNMEIRGIWDRVLKEGKSQIVNNPACDPDRRRTPKGHPPITSFMGVPLKSGDRTFGMIGLANKESGYDLANQQDIETLSLAFVEALNRKRADQEIRWLNRKLTRYSAKLVAVNKELEAFSYSVSHDLRAPLIAIDGFSRRLLENCSHTLDDKGKRFLNVIREETQRMGDLIDGLLTLSRLGRREIKPSVIDMKKLAKSVFEELKAIAPRRKVQLKIRTLSPAHGDNTMIRQVFANLLSNAIKFTGPEETSVVEIGSKVKEDENIYYVKDNGVGFDMRYVNKLFGVFERLHSAKDFEGTGVGLATVKRIIHRHGGRVWAEGKVNEGAMFYFTLPRKGEKYAEFERS